jgi:peroxiredoxin
MNKLSILNILDSNTMMVLLSILTVFATASCADAASPGTGEIAVGERAPAFTLQDQHDREISLAAMLKSGPVAVVFIRSISWCTYCQLQTVQLSENLAEIQAAGGQVVIVSYDSPEIIKRFAQRRNIKVPILSDNASKTIDAYEMRALTTAGDQTGSARHGTFVIDQSGVIRSEPYLTSFEGRAAVDALVSAFKEARKPK